MKRIAVVVATSFAFIAFAAGATLPPPPPKSDAEKAAEAQKAAAAKAKEAAALEAAVDRAVANYRKNKGIAAPMAEKKGKKKY
jgi:hypothetical protein